MLPLHPLSSMPSSKQRASLWCINWHRREWNWLSTFQSIGRHVKSVEMPNFYTIDFILYLIRYLLRNTICLHAFQSPSVVYPLKLWLQFFKQKVDALFSSLQGNILFFYINLLTTNFSQSKNLLSHLYFNSIKFDINKVSGAWGGGGDCKRHVWCE